MYTGVYAKSSQDADFQAMLLDTEDAWLIETLPGKCHDTFCGYQGWHY